MDRCKETEKFLAGLQVIAFLNEIVKENPMIETVERSTQQIVQISATDMLANIFDRCGFARTENIFKLKESIIKVENMLAKMEERVCELEKNPAGC